MGLVYTFKRVTKEMEMEKKYVDVDSLLCGG